MPAQIINSNETPAFFSYVQAKAGRNVATVFTGMADPGLGTGPAGTVSFWEGFRANPLQGATARSATLRQSNFLKATFNLRSMLSSVASSDQAIVHGLAWSAGLSQPA